MAVQPGLCPTWSETSVDRFSHDEADFLHYRDASWETEPHAFQELLERHNHCDAKICRCAEGRKYDNEGR